MGYVVENDVVPRGSAANATTAGTDSTVASAYGTNVGPNVGTGTYATGTDIGTQGTLAGATTAQPVIMTGSGATATYGTQPGMTGTGVSSSYGTQPTLGGVGSDSFHSDTHINTSSDHHNTDQKKGFKEKAADKVDQIMPKLDQHKGGRGGKADGVIEKVEHGLGKVHDKLTPGTNNSPHLPANHK